MGFPDDSAGEEFTCNAEDAGLNPGLGSIPSKYSCLENPMDREAWQATVLGVTMSQTQLSKHACTTHYLVLIQNAFFSDP